MDQPSLAGKVAIVTGAALGMGAATARLFAAAGAKVVVADFNREQGEQVAREIVAAGGVACFQKTDVARASEVEAMVAAAVDRFGRLDVAVNNAATAPDCRPIAEMEETEFDRVMAVNLKGVALCLKYEVSQMLRQGGGGSIVNIGSTSSFRPQASNAAYVAAKHGVIGLTKVAALENGVHGIRVNAVAPGAIDTPMLRGAMATLDLTEEDLAPALSLFNRFGRAEEVAQASLWLASELSTYVTGATLSVDAGYVNR